MLGTDAAAQADTSSSPVYLDAHQAAALLNVPVAAVYELIADGTIPATRLSKNRTRIPAFALVETLRARTSGGTVAPPKIEVPAVPPADGSMTKAERNAWLGAPAPSQAIIGPAGRPFRPGGEW